MQSLLGSLSALATAALLASTSSAQQVVLDFEDLSGFAPMTPGYGGIADWGSWAHSDLPGLDYPAFSGVNKILSVGLQQPIVFGQDLIFDGARVVTALDFSFELYYQGNLVHTTMVVTPNTGGPAVFLPSGYDGLVDEMRYVSAVNVHGVDDFMYRFPVAPVGTNYCMSSANSSGSASVISATGSASVAANDLTLMAGPMADMEPGIFYFGPNQIGAPFGNGTRCVGGAVVRLYPPMPSVGGVLTRTVDLASAPASVITPMSTWNFQAWFRDPAGGGLGFDLSDGLQIDFVP